MVKTTVFSTGESEVILGISEGWKEGSLANCRSNSRHFEAMAPTLTSLQHRFFFSKLGIFSYKRGDASVFRKKGMVGYSYHLRAVEYVSCPNMTYFEYRKNFIYKRQKKKTNFFRRGRVFILYGNSPSRNLQHQQEITVKFEIIFIFIELLLKSWNFTNRPLFFLRITTDPLSLSAHYHLRSSNLSQYQVYLPLSLSRWRSIFLLSLFLTLISPGICLILLLNFSGFPTNCAVFFLALIVLNGFPFILILLILG